jgi:hypothetical protein
LLLFFFWFRSDWSFFLCFVFGAFLSLILCIFRLWWKISEDKAFLNRIREIFDQGGSFSRSNNAFMKWRVSFRIGYVSIN